MVIASLTRRWQQKNESSERLGEDNLTCGNSLHEATTNNNLSINARSINSRGSIAVVMKSLGLDRDRAIEEELKRLRVECEVAISKSWLEVERIEQDRKELKYMLSAVMKENETLKKQLKDFSNTNSSRGCFIEKNENPLETTTKSTPDNKMTNEWLGCRKKPPSGWIHYDENSSSFFVGHSKRKQKSKSIDSLSQKVIMSPSCSIKSSDGSLCSTKSNQSSNYEFCRFSLNMIQSDPGSTFSLRLLNPFRRMSEPSNITHGGDDYEPNKNTHEVDSVTQSDTDSYISEDSKTELNNGQNSEDERNKKAGIESSQPRCDRLENVVTMLVKKLAGKESKIALLESTIQSLRDDISSMNITKDVNENQNSTEEHKTGIIDSTNNDTMELNDLKSKIVMLEERLKEHERGRKIVIEDAKFLVERKNREVQSVLTVVKRQNNHISSLMTEIDTIKNDKKDHISCQK